MIYRRSSWHLTVGLFTMLLASSSLGGDELMVAARSTVQQAEEMVQSGKFETAGALLSNLDCKGHGGCETLRQFSRGFLYQAWAGADRQHRDLFLALAVEFYDDAHQISPENVQILGNLLLAARSAGNLDIAVEAAEELVALDSGGAYENYFFLGDLLLAQDDQQGAIKAYQSAIKSNRARPGAHRRLMNLYIGKRNNNEVFRYSQQIGRDFPEIAIGGFSYTVNSEYRHAGVRAEKALIRWVALSADLGQISVRELYTLPLPSVWNFDGIKELHKLIGEGEIDIRWWSETDERRDAVSRLLRRQAAMIRASENSESLDRQNLALELLSRAVTIAPHFEAYLYGPLKGGSNAQLDAAADLVSLHHAIKADANYDVLTDISAAQLEDMTQVLFSGKARAYAAGQLNTIQRYHTVLGMVYYETGRIESDWADNAEYQLYHALQTAERIAGDKPGRYQALPELERMLADVYFQRGEKGKGAERSLRAAMGFLETDNLPAAAAALNSTVVNGADTNKTEAVASILHGRKLIDSKEFQAAEVAASPARMSAELAWLVVPGTLPLDADFVARQRFKALADLANKLDGVGRSDLARQFYTQALDCAYRQRALTSLQDVRRLQWIKNSKSGMSAEPPTAQKLDITRAIDSHDSNDSGSVWSLPSGQGAITIGKDTL